MDNFEHVVPGSHEFFDGGCEDHHLAVEVPDGVAKLVDLIDDLDTLGVGIISHVVRASHLHGVQPA